MTNKEAIEYLKLFHGYDLPIQEALEMAIEALENNDKLADDLQNCLEMYKKKKAEVKALQEPEIIHCKDCKYSDRYAIWGKNRLYYCTEFGMSGLTEDDFCSKAERRTDE